MAAGSHDREVDELVQKLKAERPGNPRVTYLESRQLMTREEWRTAAKMLELLSQMPALQKDSLLARRVDWSLGACSDWVTKICVSTLLRAVQRDALDVDAKINLAETLVSLNRLSEAFEEYKEIRQLVRTSPDVDRRYAQLLLSTVYRQSPDNREWNKVIAAINGIVDLNRMILGCP